MKRSKFNFTDRKKKDTLVLIPGWATDHRIFGGMELEYNYLLPVVFSPFNFKRELAEALEEHKISKPDILGWSLGAFCAVDFASDFPDSAGRLALVSARKKYPAATLGGIRKLLERDRKAFLYKFYRECFFRGEKGFPVFKSGLMRAYLAEMSDEYLAEGLDYLSMFELSAEKIKGMRLRFMHGEEDRVAPYSEILELKSELPGQVVISFKDTGHMPFLNPAFAECMKDE